MLFRSDRRHKGSKRDRVGYLSSKLMRTELVADPGRVSVPGELGELGRMQRSQQVEMRPLPSAFYLPAFHYPHLDGTPPVLTNRSLLASAMEAAKFEPAA